MSEHPHTTALIKDLQHDQEQWRKAMGLVASALGEDHLSGAKLSEKALTIRADLEEATETIAALRSELEAANEQNDELHERLSEALSVDTTDGMTASEWVARTGRAERLRNEAVAELEAVKAERDRLAEIGELLHTQDNQCTAEPMFIVQRKRRMYGLDPDLREEVVWIDTAYDCDEADAEMSARLDALDEEGESLEGWVKTGYVDQWEFVTACFTEAACEKYRTVNRHRLGETRTYVDSGYRNQEWIAIREFLKSLYRPEATT